MISGDSLLLRGNPGPQGQIPKERCVVRVGMRGRVREALSALHSVLHLADIQAPRMGTSTREDEVRAISLVRTANTQATSVSHHHVCVHTFPAQ